MFLQDASLEWALMHHRKFADSDFFPRCFEYDAISAHWSVVKDELRKVDIEDYTPRTPVTSLAPKARGTYRIVHQLEPMDAILYTALVYEVCQIIEQYRIPAGEHIACSYRICPDTNGSFFDRSDGGWNNYTEKSEELAAKFPDGWVLMCDVTDFYNQIYLHRIQNVISEAGGCAFIQHAKALEIFLTRLNTNTSRGIPVGPAASMVLAEAIMGDVDKKIATITRDFTRWVDDIRIFLPTKTKAREVLHELTRYLYTSHRLVFSDSKTRIIKTQEFKEKYQKSEAKREKEAVLQRFAVYLQDKDVPQDDPYVEPCEESENQESVDFEQLEHDERFRIIAGAYEDLFRQLVTASELDVGLTRHLLKQATRYRYRNLVPIVLADFDRLLPAIREAVIYLNRVLNEEQVRQHSERFWQLHDDESLKLPFVNIWWCYLLQNPIFNCIDLPLGYESITRYREKALIAKRKNDKTWVKGFKDGLDTLGPWDKCAVLYSASVISEDEMRHWASVASRRGGIMEKAIAAHICGNGHH